MIFDLRITSTSDAYKADSQSLGFHDRGAPLCISTIVKGQEMFLAIGEPESNFANDPDFQSMKATGKLRFFNPFDPTSFESKNATLVISFYVRKAHHTYRGHLNPLAVQFTQYFWDKCYLVLEIVSYGSLPQLARAGLEKELSHISMLKNWRIKTTEPANSG